MKEQLYLKDQQLKEFVEKIFTTYRETFSDAKNVLDKYSLGIAHQKVMHLVSLYEGITISGLLKKLKVTAMSPLGELRARVLRGGAGVHGRPRGRGGAAARPPRRDHVRGARVGAPAVTRV